MAGHDGCSDGFESHRDSHIFKKAKCSWSVTRLWVVFFKPRETVTNLPARFLVAQANDDLPANGVGRLKTYLLNAKIDRFGEADDSF